MRRLESSMTSTVEGGGRGSPGSLSSPGSRHLAQEKSSALHLPSIRSCHFSPRGQIPRGPPHPVQSPIAPAKPGTSLRQVDGLKARLATQEGELRQKNEDADKLIQVVGVETDKVSREKAMADEEERRVALIMLEVKQKQKDCEEDLAKAEPALTAAQAALNTLNKVRGSSVRLSHLLTPPGVGVGGSRDPDSTAPWCPREIQGPR